ncbi:MAG: hypothetical protein AAFP09_00015 [Cyanobacteria bacterium J06607_10]
MFSASTLSAMSLAVLVSLGLAPSRSLAQSTPVIPANPAEPSVREPVSMPDASTPAAESSDAESSDAEGSEAEGSETTSPSFEPAPLVSPDAASVETANYSDGEMSLDYPATWQVEVNQEGIVAISSTSTASAEQVLTQVFRVASPPGPLVDANIDSFIEEGAAVSRYSSVTIDEQSALVMWLADRPTRLGSAIATFIGYGNETIFLFSQYSPESEGAEDSILQMHSSFSNLTTAEGVDDSELPGEAVPAGEESLEEPALDESDEPTPGILFDPAASL